MASWEECNITSVQQQLLPIGCARSVTSSFLSCHNNKNSNSNNNSSKRNESAVGGNSSLMW